MRWDPRHKVNYAAPFMNLERLIKKSGINLVLPFYHAVSDHPGPHLKQLYRIKSTKEFITDLEKLCRHFDPLSPEIFLSPGLKIPRPGFVLSFDDGLKEVHDIIAPILVQKGIPAIFFLNNSFIDNKALFYRYKVSLLVSKLLEMQSNGVKIKRLSIPPEFNGESNKKLIARMIKLSYEEEDQIDKLCEAFEIDISAFLMKKNPYLTSKEINDLKNRGFYLGSHSFDHPEFLYLDPAQQEKEILKSTEDIQKRFGLDYAFFAFPFSDYGVEKRLIERILSESNKKIDAVFGTGGIRIQDDAYHFQRLSMEKYRGDSERILKMEYLFHLIKQIIM